MLHFLRDTYSVSGMLNRSTSMIWLLIQTLFFVATVAAVADLYHCCISHLPWSDPIMSSFRPVVAGNLVYIGFLWIFGLVGGLLVWLSMRQDAARPRLLLLASQTIAAISLLLFVAVVAVGFGLLQ